MFHFVNTIQKVRRTVFGCVQVQRGRRANTILHRQKRLLSFQNAHFFLNHKKHSGLKSEVFLRRRLCEWQQIVDSLRFLVV